MKQDKTCSPDNPANLANASRRQFILPLITVLTTTVTLGAFAHEHRVFSNSAGAKLKPGDIVYTDSGHAMRGGFINKVDHVTGEQSVISSGGYLGFFGYPIDVAFDRNGQLIVANEACLLRIDPYTINPESPDLSSGQFDGDTVRIEPATGKQTLIARGHGSVVNPCVVAIVPSSGPTHTGQHNN
jgi:hypothetical protein